MSAAMARLGAFGLMALAAALSACASSQAEQPPSLLSETAPPSADPAPGTYQLSDKELNYGCKKLTGVIQVRLLQIRGYEQQSKPSLAARGMQSVTTPIFGGTTQGADPDGQYRRDLAMLHAYNRRLAEKGCKTFDIDAELKRTGLFDTPTPVDRQQ